LFAKVQRGQITAEEAMQEIEKLLGKESTMAPEFMARLEESLREAPLQAKQLFLSDEGYLCEPAENIPEKKATSRPRQPGPALPPDNQFRVEIWRESKRGKKHIRVVSLP
jgi:hypothetical protein